MRHQWLALTLCFRHWSQRRDHFDGRGNVYNKNGYLNANDVVGSLRYMDANGDMSVGTIINLKNVNFGGLDLNNVRASVVRNQKAPLLLGQNVLGRLGRIEIDNSKNILIVTHNNLYHAKNTPIWDIKETQTIDFQ